MTVEILVRSVFRKLVDKHTEADYFEKLTRQ